MPSIAKCVWRSTAQVVKLSQQQAREAQVSIKSVNTRQVQARWRSDIEAIPGDLKLSKSDYKDLLAELQEALMIRHNALMAEKKRAIIVFEGWDAAGKGGAIKRLTSPWDPRGYKVWPIAAPDAHERARHYLYRFWKRLPGNGEIAIFDRSWYGRVMVERVEGFCDEAAWTRSYGEINDFEKTLIDNGSQILKFFVHVSPDEQAERFTERLEIPHKRWKITQEDFRNRRKREPYVNAIEDMLARTHKKKAPWVIIPGEHKRFARIAILTTVLKWLDTFGLDLEPALSPEMKAFIESI